MSESRTLRPEDRIAHYRVVGPLGAGGMGEVYIAEDQKLDRNVAIKVLPTDLVKSEDRVRRFVHEAKAASSLNHPNIITIHDIGAEPLISATGEESEEKVHYISMELVRGRTLGTKIHEENTDLRTLLNWMAQAAEGVAKAHAVGIVHRDIKPGNIMVTDDGFAKVLDFGLAKLTEKAGPDAGSSATALLPNNDHTAEGTILGSIHYMSPEQVQGKVVDHRSDIFSFGCILYEAATRQRPFQGESAIETMHTILHDKPTPIQDINDAVPNELVRLIRRCLKKAPDRRLQSMKDLALELQEIAGEYDELSHSGTTQGSGLGMAPGATATRKPWLPIAAALILIVAVGAWFATRNQDQNSNAIGNTGSMVQISTATRSGRVGGATISRDGRYLAYTENHAGQISLSVQQIATEATVVVVPASERPLMSLQFSPDGNYLYYTTVTPDAPRYRTLYRIPSLGGQAEKRGFDVDSSLSFSPDGSEAVFERQLPGGAQTIQRMNMENGDLELLASVEDPGSIENGPSWSPDGLQVAIPTFYPPPAMEAAISLIDIASGVQSELLRRKPGYFNGVAWVTSGKGLIFTGIDPDFGINPQVYYVSLSDGTLRRLTNDQNNYESPEVSEDGVLSVLRTSARPDLWTADLAGNQELLVHSTSSDNAPVGSAVAGNSLVYVRRSGADRELLVYDEGSPQPRRIEAGDDPIVGVSAGNETIYLQILDFRSSVQEIWRVNLDGDDLIQVIPRSATALGHTADGQFLAYVEDEEDEILWVYSEATGESRAITNTISGRTTYLRFSDDAQRLLTSMNDFSGEFARTVYKIFDVEEHAVAQDLGLDADKVPRDWVPGENAITYYDNQDPQRNLWSIDLDSGERKQLTAFSEGQITNAKFSHDGKQLAVVSDTDEGTNLWILGRGSLEARQLTTFTGQAFFDWNWLGDSSKLFLSVGEVTRDVALIRGFE